MKFTVKFSKDVKVATWATFIIMGIVAFDVPLLIYFDVPLSAVFFVFGVISLSVALTVYLVLRFQVKGYTLDPDGLVIERRWNNVIIALDQIEAVEGDSEFRRSIRVWGIGGVLGHYGKFKKLGGATFTAYVTDLKNCIVINTNDRRIVISPHERELFLDTLAALRPDLPINISSKV